MQSHWQGTLTPRTAGTILRRICQGPRQPNLITGNLTEFEISGKTCVFVRWIVRWKSWNRAGTVRVAWLTGLPADPATTLSFFPHFAIGHNQEPPKNEGKKPSIHFTNTVSFSLSSSRQLAGPSGPGYVAPKSILSAVSNSRNRVHLNVILGDNTEALRLLVVRQPLVLLGDAIPKVKHTCLALLSH